MIGERLGVRPRVAVRVNPDFQIKGSGMRMGGGPQQFGVDAEKSPSAADRAVRATSSSSSAFTSSPARRTSAPRSSARPSARRSSSRCASPMHRPLPIRYLNLGGGFGIPYFERDEPLDLGAIAENLRGLLDAAIRPRLPDARVVIELGRYIVGECGFYVTRVVDRKESRGKTFLVVDGGLHHQLAASGNFGQVIRRNYPVAIGGRSADDADRDSERRRLSVHATGLARRRRVAATGGCRRPRRRLPGRSLRPDRQPNRVSQPSGTRRGTGVTAINREESMPQSTVVSIDNVKEVLIETLGSRIEPTLCMPTPRSWGRCPSWTRWPCLNSCSTLSGSSTSRSRART